MLGDTPYDAYSAGRAGVVTLGMTCGGNPADVLAHLAEAVTFALPSPTHLTRSTLDFFMGEALTVAADNLADGGLPIGTVVARGDGSVAVRAADGRHRSRDLTAHADRLALSALGTVPDDAVLVTTLVPCVMCAAAAMDAAVDTVVYALGHAADDGPTCVVPPSAPGTRTPRFVGGVRSDESAALFRRWLDLHGTDSSAVAAIVRQLLASEGSAVARPSPPTWGDGGLQRSAVHPHACSRSCERSTEVLSSSFGEHDGHRPGVRWCVSY